MEDIRLQKFLAEAGIASRRKAEELIVSGRVLVNGAIVTRMGTKIAETDMVEVDGKKVYIETQKRYIMLNKPTGYITTVKDQFSRPTVIDLVKNIGERVYPVGRLDYDTSGLLLLTNDGDFTYQLTHPKHEVEKIYIAEVNGIPSRDEIFQFEEGIEIDGVVTSKAVLNVLENRGSTSVLEIKIHEGRNRQVRKMCDAIGHTVISLQRIAIGKLTLEGLPEGKWRDLTEEEVHLMQSEIRKEG